jgi:hypothetical protein
MMDIHFTDYLRYRAETRGFDLSILSRIMRHSSERYRDTETRRHIVVGKHGDRLVLIAYEQGERGMTPVTVHATSRQQIHFRLQTGRLEYE